MFVRIHRLLDKPTIQSKKVLSAADYINHTRTIRI